jgi:hypothetical protein
MKKLVKVEEVEGEGLIGLMGETVMLLCLNYIYAGKLVGVNDSFVQLENAHIVYETGPFTDKYYKDAQKLNSEVFYVQTSAIEAFGKGKDLK